MAYRLTPRRAGCTKCGGVVEVREVWSDAAQRGSPEHRRPDVVTIYHAGTAGSGIDLADDLCTRDPADGD
ncbi:MAG TPA: hypothetical protein VGN35_00295 [Jatrophihabitantaceae bacterium]|nr:hypothetical protein [Jatrophihabitantaceae bacterium]